MGRGERRDAEAICETVFRPCASCRSRPLRSRQRGCCSKPVRCWFVRVSRPLAGAHGRVWRCRAQGRDKPRHARRDHCRSTRQQQSGHGPDRRQMFDHSTYVDQWTSRRSAFGPHADLQTVLAAHDEQLAVTRCVSQRVDPLERARLSVLLRHSGSRSSGARLDGGRERPGCPAASGPTEPPVPAR
jgi:hypothetical protein